MTTLPLDRFGTLSLDELLAQAELLTRFDRKYVLDRDEAARLLRRLDPRTRVLEIDGRSWFHYESVYFDTPDLLSYRQAAHVRRRRFKVRTRSYLDSGLAFLEVKVRGDREITVKDRLPYQTDARDRLTETGHDYAENTLGQHGLDSSVTDRLAPTLTTRYTRATLLPPEPGVRVTIDTGLTWQGAGSPVHLLPHSAAARQIWQPGLVSGSDCTGGLELPGLVIVETKSGAHPSGVDRLLWRSGHRPASISKYGTGLAALRDDLPANKWTRILRRHFHTEEQACAA
ncbi:polyphosphate polymerase domain-containing protein [Gordonia sp. (in: high G+C Gram-positive bacteria)]|uniref:polyphosphate polymerase domain-containing protein n=1 Tax=Gordonia sp. (in: high G+C Gram-positive bacteria) TaxID=84139 RepID=UPI0026383595|nr:polyphosphate polymerase domain-containing protein [Gordonia sp. (in: high G+C Gram-positive bacteria)]